jgi:hypothetical protein
LKQWVEAQAAVIAGVLTLFLHSQFSITGSGDDLQKRARRQ